MREHAETPHCGYHVPHLILPGFAASTLLLLVGAGLLATLDGALGNAAAASCIVVGTGLLAFTSGLRWPVIRGRPLMTERRAGISEAVLFQRYRTKLELFYAAMIPPPLALPGEASGHGLPEDLGTLVVSIMAYFRNAMPVLLQLVLHPSFNLAELADRETRMPLHRLGDAIATCLERYRREGVITAGPDRIQAATLTLIASIHSLALFERMGCRPLRSGCRHHARRLVPKALLAVDLQGGLAEPGEGGGLHHRGRGDVQRVWYAVLERPR